MQRVRLSNVEIESRKPLANAGERFRLSWFCKASIALQVKKRRQQHNRASVRMFCLSPRETTHRISPEISHAACKDKNDQIHSWRPFHSTTYVCKHEC